MGSELPRNRRADRRSALPWLVLAASLALTGLVAYLAGAAADARDQVRFRNAAIGTEARIVGRLEVYVALLRGGAGLFATDPQLTIAGFRDYAERLELRGAYPGARGIGFARRAAPAQLDSIAAALDSQGVAGFQVRPATPRPEYYPIVYLEPMDERNRRSIGYDMYTEGVRRAAMDRARDSGQAALTARVRPAQAMGADQQGFLIYLPVYTPGPTPRTVAERRQRLMGFVYAPFRAGELFRSIFQPEHDPDVAFRVYDGDQADPEHLLFSSPVSRDPDFSRTSHLDFAGRRWTVQFASTSHFESGLRRRLSWALAALGAATSLLLWWLTRAQELARAQAVRLAGQISEHAVALQQQVAQTQALNRDLEESNVDLLRARAEALDGARRTERLQAAAESLAEAATPRQVADAVIRAALSVAGVRAVLVYDCVNDELELLRADGEAEVLAAVTARQDRSLARSAEECAPSWEAGHGVAALPLLVDGRARGVLAVAFQETHELADPERTYWLTMARMAGQAMDRARLFAAEQEARAEAEEANRAKGEFLSAMSHELRTPLNAIGGYAELLEMGIRGPVSPEQKTDLERIRRAQRHLLGLINDVLNFTRLDAGKVDLRCSQVPLSLALSDLRAMTEPQVRERGLQADYADEDCEHTVHADPERLQQILLNLVGNAIKFTASGGRIEVSCAASADRVQVRVADTGRGIPPDRLHAIFDPFVQVDRRGTELSQQGVGLGLAISRDLARAMGGDITVRSEVGEGSVFTLTLPRDAPTRA